MNQNWYFRHLNLAPDYLKLFTWQISVIFTSSSSGRWPIFINWELNVDYSEKNKLQSNVYNFGSFGFLQSKIRNYELSSRRELLLMRE